MIEDTRYPDLSVNEFCPECDSLNIHFDSVFGFYKCEDCCIVWGSDSDDPDYQEIEDSLDEEN
jgi:hypothetical protein